MDFDVMSYLMGASASISTTEYTEAVEENTDIIVTLNEYKFGKVVCLYVNVDPKTSAGSDGTVNIQLSLHNPPPLDLAIPTAMTLSYNDRNISTQITLSTSGAMQLLGPRAAGRSVRTIIMYIIP